MVDRFVPGLELSRRFYLDCVGPLLADHFRGLAHAAALLGDGSEVLGFDTARSADHDWGPRVAIFLRSGDAQRYAEDVVALLSDCLPKTFLGFATHFVTRGTGVRHREATDCPISHQVDVTDLDAWFARTLGFDARRRPTTRDWLATPTQLLAGVTGGAVFHDDLGELTLARRNLSWYPTDVWRYVLACQWQRVAEREAFVGRCGEVGDELGSAVVAAQLVRELMRLCLLQQRRYPPYDKWLGAEFARSTDAAALTGTLSDALTVRAWREREAALAVAYQHVASAQNRLALAPSVDPGTRRYHDRPFQVLHAERFSAALRARIVDAGLRQLPLVA